VSKQKRSAGSAQTPAGRQDAAKDAPAAEHSNQAVMERLEAPEQATSTTHDLSAVREVALGLVERGVFALNTAPRPPELVARYVDVLETSRLPIERKRVLIEKLETDQEAAVEAAAAAARCFGGVEAGREVLERVWTGLQEGQHAPEGNGLTERADRWITAIAGSDGASTFCREVHLLLALEEEEEEDLGWSPLGVEMD
jgi:hypothetical protein